MLTLQGRSFSTGRCRFFDSDGSRETAKIYVRVLTGGSETPVFAQVDTGAAWSILNTEIAEEVRLFDSPGEPAQLSTRAGLMDGNLVRASLTILAEEGDSLQMDATVFVSRDWNHGTFLGYGGLLERIRFAVDPQKNEFFFGLSET